MDEIEAWLRQVCNTADGPYLRPFAPNPRWRYADVLIVGTNPATPLRTQFLGFDEYWTSLTEYPEIFDRQYRAMHGGGESKSAARMRHLVDQLRPLNSLVTNAYAYPSKNEKLIPDKRRQAEIGLEIVRRLAKLSEARAAIFHGSEAIRIASLLVGCDLDPYKPLLEQDARLRDSNATRVYVYPHFSGRGVRKGFRVGQMDTELGRLAEWLSPR